MKTPFRTQFNPKYKGSTPEAVTQDSKTIPDDCLSLRQLLINHTRGIGTPPQKQGIYTGTAEIPVFTDITDKVEHLKNLKQQQKDLEKQIKDEKQQAKEEKAKKSEPKATEKVQISEPKEGDAPSTETNKT